MCFLRCIVCNVGNNGVVTASITASITVLLTALLFSVTSNLINYFSLVATPLPLLRMRALLRVAIRPALGWTVRFFKALSGVWRSIKPDAYRSVLCYGGVGV